MNIDLQSEVVFGDVNAMMIFFGDHAFSHQTIAQNIPTSNILVFPLVEVENFVDWLNYHGNEHDSIATALNLSVPADIRDVDFSDQTQFYDWMYNHRMLHDLINTTLGI